ncbi:MAG: large conductance mechanosensitive channel protein MscL [Actinomycetota bacterium]|nr:large conductance mechanosensitive channel protein MscL [Actinomycetota bacterium]
MANHSILGEMKTFILRGNVIDLAVGVVVGTAFQSVVKGFVADLLTPLIGIPGKVDFAALQIRVDHSVFRYGDFANQVVSFVIVAVTVFFAVVKPVNALRARRSAGKESPPSTRQCPECLSDIALAARRCAFCTSQVPVAAPAPDER